MPTAPPQPPEPSDGKSELADLQAQHLDLIDRYVRRRVPDPEQAERVVREVFQDAGANPAQVQANPLPWLIGAARRACAQARRANPPQVLSGTASAPSRPGYSRRPQATLRAQGRLVVGEEAGELLGSWGHAEALGGRPVIDLAARELEPPFERLEHLDLERGEEHGEVRSFREGVSTIEVGTHQLNDGLVMLADVPLELVEGREEVFA